MSKITNCFLMLELLNSGSVYSVSKLSKELGVTERMVRYYKEQLELSGYPIESFKGPGGGYFLNKNNYININYFNKYDLEVLDRIVNNGDTVIVIEHNLDVIKVADYIIDLGPGGGNKGGNIIAKGSPEEVSKVKESYTAEYLKSVLKEDQKRKERLKNE